MHDETKTVTDVTVVDEEVPSPPIDDPVIRQVVSELKQAAASLEVAEREKIAGEVRYDLALSRWGKAYDYIAREFTEHNQLGHDDAAKALAQLTLDYPFIDRHVYTTMSLADAIHSVLYLEKDPFTLEQIVNDLEKGGYQFRSGSHRREVNGALINNKSVKQVGKKYALRARAQRKTKKDD